MKSHDNLAPLSNLTIPPEALEAGARDVAAVMGYYFYTLPEDDRELATSMAHAAFTAMVSAWPGMEMKGVGIGDGETTIEWLHLPLQEKADGN